MPLRFDPPKSIVILSGAGLSVASGIPTFRGPQGLWNGHRLEDVASPRAWQRNATLVRRFYDERRVAAAALLPNPGHFALARLQQRWGEERVGLITQNVDGMLDRSGAPQVVQMHGSINRLRCELDDSHPKVGVFGDQNPEAVCVICNSPMRPDVVWFGEHPYFLDEIEKLVTAADLFLSIGTSGTVYPAAGLAALARNHGAKTIEINPEPTGGPFDHIIEQPCEIALPAMVAYWLGEDPDEND